MTDILVDGYNVIKNNAMFQFLEVKSRAEARMLLIKQLRNKYLHSTDTIIVIFDGDGAKEQVSHEEHIRVIFSRHGETADSVIKRLAAEACKAGRHVAMYSNDAEVRRAVMEAGGQVHTTGQLTKHLTAAPHDAALRSAHRQWARRVYGIDPMYKGDDEPGPPRSQGKKKKKRKK
jgi:uncharacterized protein